MKHSPFYRDVYYAGKLTYDMMRHVFNPRYRSWRSYSYSEIMRPSKPWLARMGHRFIVHVSYPVLLRRATNRKKLK